jgi:hypothetical protein
LGDCTNRLSLCFRFSSEAEGWRRSRTMVFGGRVYSPGDLRGRWGSAGGSWRLLAAQRAEKSLVSQTKATEAPSLRFVALRRPALAVGHGVVAGGWPPRCFFELLKSCLQKLVLAVSTTARAALAPAVRPAEVRRDALVVLSAGVHLVCDRAVV